jgi:hypothetical protein
MEQDNSRGMRQKSVWSRQRRVDERILPGNHGDQLREGSPGASMMRFPKQRHSLGDRIGNGQLSHKVSCFVFHIVIQL